MSNGMKITGNCPECGTENVALSSSTVKELYSYKHNITNKAVRV